MNANELAAGEAALQACVEKFDGWLIEKLVPEWAYATGVTEVMACWDAAPAATDAQSEHKNEASCGTALYQSIVKTGKGDQVTPDQCQEASLAVIDAVLKVRGQKRPFA